MPIGVDPKTVRRERSPDNPEIREERRKIAEKRRRFGYRRVRVMPDRAHHRAHRFGPSSLERQHAALTQRPRREPRGPAWRKLARGASALTQATREQATRELSGYGRGNAGGQGHAGASRATTPKEVHRFRQ